MKLISIMFLLFVGANQLVNAKSLTIHFNKLSINFDPHNMIDARSMQINLQIHRGLFRYLPNGDVVSDLAKSWEFSEDKLRLTVTLKNSTFSNGNLIKAKHVVNSFKRIFAISAGIAADLSSLIKLNGINNKIEIGVREIDYNKIEFKLNSPNSIFLKQLATVDCSILEIENEGDLPDVKIGAGPYKVVSYEENLLILEKWRKDSIESSMPPQKIEIKFTNEKSIENLISNNNLDSLDQNYIDKIEEAKLIDKNWFKVVSDMTKENFLIINPNVFNLEERRFISEQIDVIELSKQLGKPFIPAFGLIPPVLSGAVSTKQNFKKSTLKHLDRKIELIIPNTWDYKDILRTSLLKSLKSNKLNIKIKEVSFDEWNKAKKTKKYEILLNARGIDYPDGISILNYFKSGVEGNFYFCNDPHIDSLLNDSVKQFDTEKKQIMYKQIQNKILEKHVVVPLFFGSRASGYWGPRVKYVPPHPLGFHFLSFELIEMR